MYIEAPARSGPVHVPAMLAAAIGICAAGTVGMGVYPGPWVDAVMRVASALFV
jgi:hypothetical protein